MLRLKLVHNSKGGASSQVVTVDGSLPLSALRAQAAKAFSLPAEGAQLLVGFPPEPLTDEADRPLSSLLTTGTVVEVRAGASLAMAKIAVEPNGNCLFASIGFLVAGECTPAAAALQRESVVAALLSEPDTYSDAVLGCARDDYIEMIGRNATWGGAIELGLLSKLHNLEIHAIEVRTGHVYKFGEGRGYPSAGLLLYDGLHYDPLAEAGGATPRRLFEPKDCAAALAGALALAAAARASGAYCDLQGFTLRCSVCGCGVTGQSGAVEHAQKTQHSNFFEYKAAPVQA